ncbi:hypothetical protein [Nonomuraea candida]|uniref:hypothetical protein n=1 Tax=Nonomuraea candida TaxID=359159 RepID=UPI0005BB3097|nr:hypothetical protein [Nonomuraea candida]
MESPVIGLDWLFDLFKEMTCDMHGCPEKATHRATHRSFWANESRSGVYCAEHLVPMRIGKYFYRLVDSSPIP